MEKTHKNFVKGAAILGGMGFISKLIGAIYTIASTYIIGTSGMSYYGRAFPIYTFLLALSSAGLPVAIAKMVAERTTLGDYKAAYAVFRRALKAMFFIGLATTVIMIVFSGQIASALGSPDTKFAIMAIAPSLFFVAIMSAYRGYFQGMQRMTPTAVSQMIEQIIKVVAGLTLAAIWVKKGEAYGAAGAVLGISISEVVACLYMMMLYKKKISIFRRREKSVHNKQLTSRIGKHLVFLATPIIIGACAMPIVQNADSTIITHTLNGMKSVILIGKEIILDEKTINSLFSLATTYPNSITNLPAVFSLALSMSLVPSIAVSNAEHSLRGVAMKSGIGIKLSMLIGMPCAAGLYFLATPIMHLLYAGLEGDYLLIGGKLLSILAISVFFLTILQTMTGVLQGLGKTYLPVINLFIGIGAKIVVSLVTIRIPEINVQGAAYGTVACYGIAAILDVICVLKCAHARIRVIDNFFKPMLATAGMSFVVYMLMPHVESGEYSRPLTILVIMAAIAVYVFLIFFFGALKKEDMKFIPGGRRITALMIRLNIWKQDSRFRKRR